MMLKCQPETRKARAARVVYEAHVYDDAGFADERARELRRCGWSARRYDRDIKAGGLRITAHVVVVSRGVLDR